MTNHNPPYSDLYKGYFDTRNPYTENLDEAYQKPVPIPIHTAEELFAHQTLENIDQHIFRYFHFIAAQRFQLEPIKARYLAYHQVKQNLKRQVKIYSDILDDADAVKTGEFEAELEYLFECEYYQHSMSGTVKTILQDYENNISAALEAFNALIHEVHLICKKALLDFQSNLEEERKIAILTAY